MSSRKLLSNVENRESEKESNAGKKGVVLGAGVAAENGVDIADQDPDLVHEVIVVAHALVTGTVVAGPGLAPETADHVAADQDQDQDLRGHEPTDRDPSPEGHVIGLARTLAIDQEIYPAAVPTRKPTKGQMAKQRLAKTVLIVHCHC